MPGSPPLEWEALKEKLAGRGWEVQESAFASALPGDLWAKRSFGDAPHASLAPIRQTFAVLDGLFASAQAANPNSSVAEDDSERFDWYQEGTDLDAVLEAADRRRDEALGDLSAA